MELSKLLDNRKAIEVDLQGLRVASNEIRFIEATVKNIIGSTSSDVHYSVSIGQTNAMALSAAISIIATGVYIFVKAAL